jgi:polysaccharide export outer membrane protein
MTKPSVLHAVVAMVGFSLWTPPGAAQQAAIAPDSRELGGYNLPSQTIGVDDLLAVSVYGAPEVTRTVRVSAAGEIRLPMLRQPVAVLGAMPSEVEERIAKALVAEQLFVDPIVTVHVAEYKSRPISVAGAVRRPLTFQAVSTVTLLDAITRAEGLSEDAGAEILVSRPVSLADGSTRTLTQRIPVKGLIDAADPELNLKLVGGEEIRVPDAGKVFVVGNVKKPGAFRIDDAAETTVMKVLAQAEGLMPYAQKTAYIYRKEASGSKNEIAIPLDDILKRRAPDVALLANDILYVPDNTGRRKTMTALDRMATFGAGTVSGILIWRR